MNKKAYIQPVLKLTQFAPGLMEVPSSFPQGNGNDPVIDNPDDELSKKRHDDDWGSLW